MSDPSIPVTIRFARLHCTSETTETGSDEPYVVFVVSNLAAAIPQTVVQITDTFSMGEGDTRRQGEAERDNRRQLPLLWGIDGRHAAPIARAEDVLILAGLVESDGGANLALSVRNAVQASLAANIVSYKLSNLSRADLVARCRQDLRGAITLGAAPGLPFGEDECIGTAELELTPERLDVARTRGFTAALKLGGGPLGQGAHYEAYVKLLPTRA